MEPAPFGFGAAQERRPEASMLAILQLDKDQAKKAADASHADAVILAGVEPAKAAAAIKPFADVPVGLRLTKADRAAVQAAREAGADFVLVDRETAGEALLEEGIGLTLALEGEMSDVELRTLGSLPLDALAVPPPSEPFTVASVTALRRLSLLAQTPLLMDVADDIEASRLQALRDSGVAGIILDGKSAGKLKALAERIRSLPARGRRREERGEAILPSLAGVASGDDDDDDYE
jgi:hypothetical protein